MTRQDLTLYSFARISYAQKKVAWPFSVKVGAATTVNVTMMERVQPSSFTFHWPGSLEFSLLESASTSSIGTSGAESKSMATISGSSRGQTSDPLQRETVTRIMMTILSEWHRRTSRIWLRWPHGTPRIQMSDFDSLQFRRRCRCRRIEGTCLVAIFALFGSNCINQLSLYLILD